jgi:serine/threonine protein kinase
VIYDTHIVVKIPPSPIKDFKDYVRRIREETAIVAKLAPIECIIPGISVILKKISAFPDGTGVALETLEEKYVHWLEVNPKFQDYLKVGDAFVFFMDLSRYYFLSRVMESLHDVENQIHKEIAADVDAVWNYLGFESKYGDCDDSICFNLQNLYKQFDAEVRPVLKTSGQAKSMGETQKKMLFLSHLVGKDSKENYRGLSDQLVQQVNFPLSKIKAENVDVAETYGRLVKEGIRRRMFNRNKPQMEGMITNLLVLLASMGEKKVAMRDLKPDNLIVAGDPANYPAFLFSAEDYTIGLIDVETAVDFETRENKELPQPYLGGTPLYATPSHFFLNVVLNDVYSDLPRILYLQDWYAMAGIIYELATGKRLFRKTGGKVHGFMRTIQSALAERREISEVYKEISHMFWTSAKEEFDKKIGKSEKLIKSLNAEIPEDIKQWFEVYVREKKVAVDTRIKTTIQSQTHFKSEKNRRSLFGYSHEEICRLKARYKQPDRPTKLADGDVSLILQLLDDLAILKQESERLTETINVLNAPFPKLSAYDILVIMYGVVADAMYHPEWETLSVEPDEIELSAEVESTLGYTLTVQAPS